MKNRVAFVVLLAFLTSGAFADWLSLSGHPTSKGAKFYVDATLSNRSVTGAQLAHLLDFPVAQLNAYGKPYLSERSMVEYDCTKRRARTTSMAQFPGNMGSGDPMLSFDRGSAWVPFSLDPVARTMEELACGKKDFGESLFRAHPGWLDLIQTAEFLNWKQAQTAAVQAMGASTNESDAIQMIDLFKRDQQRKP